MRFPIVGLALVAAFFCFGVSAPAQVAPVTLTLKHADLQSSWKESWLTGKVTYSGFVTAASELRVSLRPRAGGRVAAAATLSDVQAGPFSGELPLPPRLLPKVYRLTVSGTSEGLQIKPVTRDLKLPAPAEGIVDRAWASRTKTGRPINTIPGSPTQVWAHFHFAVPPKSRKVRNRWYSPNFRWWGEKKNKPWTPTVHTRLAAAKLDKGVWFAYMFSENRVVKKWRVRLGNP